MSVLPPAERVTPRCGACGGETVGEFDGSLSCDDCLLVFDQDTLEASFADPDEVECAKACDNYWHGPGRINPAKGFECGHCRLPQSHEGPCWHGCKPIALA